MPSNRTTSAGCISWQPCLQTNHTITPCAVLLPLSLSLKEWRHDKRFPGWHYKLQLATHDFQDSYRKLCVAFQTFSGKNYLFSKLFKVFLPLYTSAKYTKSSFHDKIAQTSGGAGSRDGSISSLLISIRYRNFYHKMSATYNESKVTNACWSINHFQVLTANTVPLTTVCVCVVNVQVGLQSMCFRFSVTEFLSVWTVYCCILWAPNFYVALAQMTACTMQSSLGRIYIVHI